MPSRVACAIWMATWACGASGESAFDGMCRPLGYQFFVFSGGRFAGTLSPHPMDSRTDGAAQIPPLVSARELAAAFSRYATAAATAPAGQLR